jgi:Sec-independent protein translocase protein TatA
MFGLSFAELAFAALVAFILFGPEQFPIMARQAVLWIRKIKTFANQAQATLQEMGKELIPEAELKKLNKPINLKDFIGSPSKTNYSNSPSSSLKIIQLDRDPAHYPHLVNWRNKVLMDRQRQNYHSQTTDWSTLKEPNPS